MSAWRRLRHPSRYIEGTTRYGSRIGVRLGSLVRDDVRVSFEIQLSNSERVHVRILAARCARALRRLPPSRNKRAQGKPDARCTRGLACNCYWQKRTRAYRFSGGNPAFPAQWFYGLFRALPGEPSSFATVTSQISPQSLAPASGARTTRLHRPLESRSSVATFASTASHRAFVTIAIRPSHRVRRAEL